VANNQAERNVKRAEARFDESGQERLREGEGSGGRSRACCGHRGARDRNFRLGALVDCDSARRDIENESPRLMCGRADDSAECASIMAVHRGVWLRRTPTGVGCGGNDLSRRGDIPFHRRIRDRRCPHHDYVEESDQICGDATSGGFHFTVAE
jgi:hypothetical protein